MHHRIPAPATARLAACVALALCAHLLGERLEVAQRIVEKDEVGRNPADLDDRVIAVVRNKSLRKYYDPTCAELKAGDEVVVVRQATRPGPELPPE